MTTLAELNTAVAADLRDPAYGTFPTATIDSFVNAGVVEVGRISPERFEEDIVPSSSVLEYPLRSLLNVTGAESTDIFTCVAHGLQVGDMVRFRTIAGGTGITAGTAYYVIATSLTADTFKLSTALGGSAATFTTNVTAGVLVKQASPENVEVRRVELWDNATTPPTFVGRLNPASAEYINQSDVGYDVWGGVLRLTKTQLDAAVLPTTQVVRVWGYAPYPYMNAYSNLNLTPEKQDAIRLYARLQAVRILVSDRQLFTQWQTASHNSDVSLASLMSVYSTLQTEWRQRSRALMVLREAP